MPDANVKFSLIGVEELTLTLKTVNADVKKKSGRFALRKAANVIAMALKTGAQRLDDPKTSEVIARNVAIRFSPKLFKRTGHLGFRVGILGGAREQGSAGISAPGGKTFYWRFLEFGTEHISARPFVRPALSHNIGPATNEFVRQFKKALDRAIRRAVKNPK